MVIRACVRHLYHFVRVATILTFGVVMLPPAAAADVTTWIWSQYSKTVDENRLRVSNCLTCLFVVVFYGGLRACDACVRAEVILTITVEFKMNLLHATLNLVRAFAAFVGALAMLVLCLIRVSFAYPFLVGMAIIVASLSTLCR